MQIKLVRIYQKTSNFTGYRILVDRLWPRGISKERAHLDQWFKEIGPSKSLRQWFNHDPAKFCEFRDKYLLELKQNPQAKTFIQLVSQQLMQQNVIFLFGAKDLQHNQAVVLKQFVEQHLS